MVAIRHVTKKLKLIFLSQSLVQLSSSRSKIFNQKNLIFFAVPKGWSDAQRASFDDFKAILV